jgi:hypothetical protein
MLKNKYLGGPIKHKNDILGENMKEWIEDMFSVQILGCSE